MEFLQHTFVTLVALGAAAFVIRRVFATLKPTKGGSACASCEAGGSEATGAEGARSGRPRAGAAVRTP